MAIYKNLAQEKQPEMESAENLLDENDTEFTSEQARTQTLDSDRKS